MANTLNVSKLPIFTVDAFTNKPFKGNPAAVCVVSYKEVVPNSVKQQIATEMNLSETAFITVLKENDTFQNGSRFGLQWFTPKCEVPLCGHATLASSAVLFKVYSNQSPVLEFETLSGILKAKKLPGGKIEINLPTYTTKPVNLKEYEDVIKAAVGSLPLEEVVLSESSKLLIRLQDNVTVRQLQELRPRESELLSGSANVVGVIVTLRGSDDCRDPEGRPYDFVSRYFAPWFGILEDPVTGSAHSVLAPFWSKVLGKTEMYARQWSVRGGDLDLRLEEDRVAIGGHTVVMLRGQFDL